VAGTERQTAMPAVRRRRGQASCVGRVSGGEQRSNSSLTSGCQQQGKHSVLGGSESGSVPCAV
jgi:hypothetical protein